METPTPSVAAFRRIADHARAVTFMISDGILPSNEGRGYVLRRLLRQAVRAGKTLGLRDPFLYKMSGTVIDLMQSAYPETLQRREMIASVVKNEEEKFPGDARLRHPPAGRDRSPTAKTQKIKTLSGKDVFQLYDTFGFPFELTKEMVGGQGFKVDEEGFKKAQAQAAETWPAKEAGKAQALRMWIIIAVESQSRSLHRFPRL